MSSVINYVISQLVQRLTASQDLLTFQQLVTNHTCSLDNHMSKSCCKTNRLHQGPDGLKKKKKVLQGYINYSRVAVIILPLIKTFRHTSESKIQGLLGYTCLSCDGRVCVYMEYKHTSHFYERLSRTGVSQVLQQSSPVGGSKLKSFANQHSKKPKKTEHQNKDNDTATKLDFCTYKN